MISNKLSCCCWIQSALNRHRKMVKHIWKAALPTMVLFIHVCIAAGYIGPPSTFEQDMPQKSERPNQHRTFGMALYRRGRSVPYLIAASTASPSRLSAHSRTLQRRLSRRGRRVRRRNIFREWSPKSSDVTKMVDERSEGPALGDILAPEERSGGATPSSRSTTALGDIPLEPPSFLKRLFSIPKNVRRTAGAGDVVVPVIGARDGWGGIRQGLVNRGIFPGVEYRILEVTTLTESGTEQSLSSAREAPEGAFDDGDLIFTMRPVYPLVAKLERKWPVRVPAREFPVMLTPFSYNAATAWAALTTSLSLLAVGFVASQALTLSVIPSRSMEPTLQVGDVVLVEKVSRSAIIRRDDIIFFRPPPALREVVASVGGTLNTRDLFVKRVAALPGDAVSVNADGIVSVESSRPPPASPSPWATKSSRGNSRVGMGVMENKKMGEEGKSATIPGDRGTPRATPATTATSSGVLQRIRIEDKKRLPPDTIFVLGDNAEVSMDSRVWGELDEGQVVGHALLRVFPLKTFGLLP